MLSRRAFLATSSSVSALGSAAWAQTLPDLPLEPVRIQPQVERRRPLGSIASSDVSISVKDSPLPDALDMFYDFIIGVARQNGYQPGKDKMLVNNTITSFDIAQDTPYFNEELFRAFADRCFTDSPDTVGPANRTDRFSYNYDLVVKTAASRIDQKYPQIIARTRELETNLQTETDRLVARRSVIGRQWKDLCVASGIDTSDPDYELKYVTFLSQIRYADQIDQYTKNINMILAAQDAVRRSAYSDIEQRLLDVVYALNITAAEGRPRRPNYERTVPGVNELSFSNPDKLDQHIFDVAPAAYPLGDLSAFLTRSGTRNLSIGKSFTGTYKHDQSWSGGGSGRASFFGISLGGGGGSSGSSSFTQTISKTNSIDISFANVADYLVDRDVWFNPSLFQNEDLLKSLSKIPGYSRLQYVSVSLVLARGLTLTLKFDSGVDSNSWSKQNFQASGGASILGFSLGGGGSNSRYDSTVEVSGDRKSVTFKDDPQLVRVLGVRLERVIPAPAAAVASTDENSPLARFRAGKIDYLQYQNSKFQ
jgi:uncharacterized membrane protein YgcG